MNTLIIAAFAILAAFSLFEFIYCTWADKRDNEKTVREHHVK